MCAAFSKHVERNLCYESFHFVQEANAYVAAAQHITAVEQVRGGRVTLLLLVLVCETAVQRSMRNSLLYEQCLAGFTALPLLP
jgi:hypothetical protein